MRIPLGLPLGPNGGVNRWANQYPANCCKCGEWVLRGEGRLVKKAGEMQVQCYTHVEKKNDSGR